MATRFTNKERAFINHYMMCLNGTEAAARAQYKGSRETLAVIAHENLRKPKIAAEIERRFAEQTMKADEVLYRLAQQAQGLPPEVFDVSILGLSVDFEKLMALGLSHLIKKLSYDREGRPQVEFYDAQKALELVGRHYALFKDVERREDWRTDAIEYIRKGELNYKELADELGTDLATELFKAAGVPVEVGAGAEPNAED